MTVPAAVAATLVTVVLALTGCGDGGGDGGGAGGSAGGETLAESQERLVGIVDATVAAVAEGRAVTPAPSTDPVPCEGGTTFSAGYGKRLAVAGDADADALLEATRRYWEAEGYDVRTRDLTSRLPVVFAEGEEMTLSLQVVRDKGTAELAGGTPCRPRPSP